MLKGSIVRTRSIRTAGALLCAYLCLCGIGGTVIPGTLALPAANVTRFTLDNGLTVLVEEDHAFPRVALEVRVKGGSCDDVPWIGSGQAHLMEHMVFKGTERRAVGAIESEVRRYEGNFNAFTSYDYTGFSLSVGAAYAREGLDLMADALFHSSFDPAELKKESEVVRSEMRMNRDDPDRRLSQRFWNAAFQVHAYRHPIIGYEELFNRLSRDEVLAFYRARYVPNNMVLAVVGDVDTARVRRWADELFGGVARGVPFDWARGTEPPQISSRRIVETFPVQQAELIVGFHSTRLQDPDLYPLDVLAQVLGSGDSARLERRLRRELRLAHAVSAANFTPQDPGLFIIQATVDAEKIDAATDAILQEVQLVRREGVTREELERAKQQVLADYFHMRQSVAARAGDLATNELLVGDYDFGRKYVAGVQGVTNEALRRAAQRYLIDDAWTLAALLPPVRTPNPEPRTTELPAPAPPAPHAPFTFTQATLKNGIKVVIGEQHRTPLVALRVLWRGGLRAEAAETAGLSHLTAQLLVGGTAHHVAEELAGMVESRGGQLSTVSGKDAFGVSLDLLASDAPFGLDLLHEIMTQSTFPPEELDREKTRTLAQIRAREDDIFEVTSDRLRHALLGEHPYARYPLGTAQAVELFTVKDCQSFFRRHGVPQDMVLVVVGDVRASDLMPVVERTFADLTQEQEGELNTQPVQFPEEPVQDTFHLPGRQQAVVAFGHPGVEWSHRDRYALEVVQAMLSGAGGRLYQHIREQSGLSYALGAAHVAGELGGYLFSYTATVPAEVERVSQAMRDEFASLVKEPPAAEEIDLAKRALRDHYYNELQDIGAVAARVALNVLIGLGVEELERYPEQLERVSRQDVARVLRGYLGASTSAYVRALPDTGKTPETVR